MIFWYLERFARKSFVRKPISFPFVRVQRQQTGNSITKSIANMHFLALILKARRFRWSITKFRDDAKGALRSLKLPYEVGGSDSLPLPERDKVEWVEQHGFPPYVREPRCGDVQRVKWVGSWKVFVFPDRGSKRFAMESNASSLTLIQKGSERDVMKYLGWKRLFKIIR